MIKMKKWNLVTATTGLLLYLSLLPTVEAKAAQLTFDMQVLFQAQTTEALDKKIKETIIIPESVYVEEDTNEKNRQDTSPRLPFDLQVELGYQTKKELDTALVDYNFILESLRPAEDNKDPDEEENTSSKELPKIKLKSDVEAEPPSINESTGDTAVQSEYTRRDIQSYSKLIMVGDSRFVGMSSATNHSLCQWICEVSTGYDWLVSTAAAAVDASIVPGSAIVINLGVNDVYRPGDYVNYINGKAAEWMNAGADVYFMSVNPVIDGYGGSVTNASIENFNNTLTSSLSGGIGYIDTYTYLMQNGYGTGDGLHYDNSTYSAIMNYCLNQLRIS